MRVFRVYRIWEVKVNNIHLGLKTITAILKAKEIINMNFIILLLQEYLCNYLYTESRKYVYNFLLNLNPLLLKVN